MTATLSDTEYAVFAMDAYNQRIKKGMVADVPDGAVLLMASDTVGQQWQGDLVTAARVVRQRASDTAAFLQTAEE